MFITPAYAQAAAPGGSDMLMSLLPFVLIFVIMYFLILRPQQRKVKQHQEMVKGIRRGDTVVTSGGLVGKVARVVDDAEIELQVADGVKLRQLRSMIADVRTKGEPAKSEASKPETVKSESRGKAEVPKIDAAKSEPTKDDGAA